MVTQNRELQRSEAHPAEGVERIRSRRTYSPHADVYETADAIVVLADIPGVKEKDLDITLERNVLTIEGRTAEPEFPGFRPLYQEYETGDFERSFTLASGVDREHIQATVDRGVLRLVLPKSREALARKIPVKAGH